jgi:hypothetical protein
MRLSLFAAVLLAPLTLAGCDGTPIDAGAPLAGEWQSDAFHFPGTAPNGSTDVLSRDRWSLLEDGSFAFSSLVVDATTGRTWVRYAEAGSWTATESELRLYVRREFAAQDPRDAVESPVLTPVVPRLERYGHELEGVTLALSPACPANANCIAKILLHRAEVPF